MPGLPVGPIKITGSPGFNIKHKSLEPPISSTMVDSKPLLRSTHAPVSARPSMPSKVPSVLIADDSKFCSR